MSDHEHRGAGAMIERTRAPVAEEPAQVAAPRHTNGFVAAWARAVRARRGFTGAPAAVEDPPAAPARTIAAAPPPPAAVATGAGSPWLRRR